MKLIDKISIYRSRTPGIFLRLAVWVVLAAILPCRGELAHASNLQIDNLKPNQRLTNSVFTVTGRVRSQHPALTIKYRLNQGAWSQASGSTAWVAPVKLLPGTNVFEAYDTDPSGHPTLPVQLPCFLAVSGDLNLQITGSGSVSRLGFSGDRLDIGKSYAVKAIAGRDQQFIGWDGDFSGTNNPLVFAMKSNLVLRAQFAPKPFAESAGNYAGLFYPADDQGGIMASTDATNSGFLNLKLRSDGSFSGRIVLQGLAAPIIGKLGPEFQAQVHVPQPGGNPLAVDIALDPEVNILSGTVTRGTQWQSSLLARKSATSNTNEFTGRYTLLVEGCDTGGCFVGPPVPFGDCPFSVKVTQSGVIQVAGTLADGALVSQTVQAAQDGTWPLYASVYGGRGLLIGWQSLAESCDVSIVYWQKPPRPAWDKYYPGGFSNSRVALVSPYHPAAPRKNVLSWTNGIVVLSGGDLPVMLTNHITLSGTEIRNRGGSISNLNLSINGVDGSFQGSFVHPATHRTHSFKGTLVQNCPDYFSLDSGGWFLGTNTAGAIRLHPQP